jgi:hypothetical protein
MTQRRREWTRADMPAMTGYCTVADVIRIYVVTKTYAYRIANRDHWHRYRHPDGGVRYRREDVDRSLSAGTATRRAKELERRCLREDRFRG